MIPELKIATVASIILLVLFSGCTVQPPEITPQPGCGDNECSEDEAVLDANGNIISTTCKTDCGICTDDDGGVHYYLTGTATDELSGASVSDTCIGDVLAEGFCHGGEVQGVAKDCELGCLNGACEGTGAALAEGEYCVYSDEVTTIASAVGERSCRPGNQRVYACESRNGSAAWTEFEDCAARTPARECWQGTCILPTSPEILWMEFDECSGLTVVDISGNGNDGRFGLEGTTQTPAWAPPGQTRTGSGCAIEFSPTGGWIKVMDSSTLNGLASNIENSLTMEAWIKPNTSRFGRIFVKPWSFYLDQRYKNVQFIVGLDGMYDKYQATGQMDLEVLRTASEPLTIGQWNHVAATYNAVTREMKIYVNGKIEAEETIPQTHIDMEHNRASIERADHRRALISFFGWWKPFGFPGLIDDLKIYDYVKTCFDTTDDGVDDCATCKPETIKVSSAAAALGEDAQCPASGATLTNESLRAFIAEPATGLFEKQVADGGEVCIGEPISITYSKMGKYPATKTAVTRTCNEKCFKDCTWGCVDNYFEDCLSECKESCSNGWCTSLSAIELCGGTGGLTTILDINYWTHDGDQWADSYNIALDPACNYCITQCAPANFDTAANTVTYDKACGFALNEVIEVRKGGSGCSSGLVVATYPVTGIGTETMRINAPSKPGTYRACFNNQPVWEGTVKTENCPPQIGCIIVPISDPNLKVNKNQKNALLHIDLNLTNIGDTKKQYSYSLYVKIDPDETSATATGNVPDYITLEPLSSASISPDESTIFRTTINVKHMLPKLKECHKERGRKEECERERFDTSDPNKMPFYENIIVRAEAGGVGDYYCEYPITVDLVDTCTPEKQVCDGVDDDCDGIIDECIVEVEATRPEMLVEASAGPCTADAECPTGFTCMSGECNAGSCTTKADCPARTADQPINFACIDGQCSIKSPGGFEPLGNLTVGFYSRPCAESNGLSWSNWQDYANIIAACSPTNTCLTDTDGYCSTELPGGVQYTAIGVLDDGTTQKQLGVPVASCPCGHTKKVWHLSYRE